MVDLPHSKMYSTSGPIRARLVKHSIPYITLEVQYDKRKVTPHNDTEGQCITMTPL
jgi:hypothetical protein